MFEPKPDAPRGLLVTVYVNGEPVAVGADDSVAVAALLANQGSTRTSPVTGEPRAPYCMIGVCFECLMTIDGVPSRQACLERVAPGMRIERQIGPRGGL
jgi:hypothetical protein